MSKTEITGCAYGCVTQNWLLLWLLHTGSEAHKLGGNSESLSIDYVCGT